MRIAVTRTQVPFVWGGAERHSQRLCEALRQYGHEAVEVTIPFKWYPTQTLVENIFAAKLLDLSEAEGVPTDLMIGLKFPAYLVQHPNPVFWIIHQYRQAYDMWEAGTSELLHEPDGLMVKQFIEAEDREAFARTTVPVYANSRNVADRLARHLGIPSTPLYHPPPLADHLRGEHYGSRLFAPGRLNPSKRVDLILRALALTDRNVHIDIAGQAENPAYLEHLKTLADALGLENRVRWLGPISDEELIRHYATCRAVVFTPQDEDYGYITLEAMIAGKPVVTVTDAGGPLEFIRHEVNGLVADPEPALLARVLQSMADDAGFAERLGQTAHRDYLSKEICWERVVEALTGQTPRLDAAPQTQIADLSRQAPASAKDVEPAVTVLEAAIRPKIPDRLPFRSVSEVLEAYDLDLHVGPGETGGPDHDQGLVAYLETHWQRYLNTLHHVERLAPKDILDIGIFPPLVFEAMMAATMKGVTLRGVWEGPDHIRTTFRSRSVQYPDIPVEISPANAERDHLPFADESFDLVLAMEIFEHLALDPHFFLCEAWRVLRPGGHLVITTPNICSHRGVRKMLSNEAPYSFGIFVPTGGVYGRHNREYAPRELAVLGQAAGFETEFLGTADVYDKVVDASTAELLLSRSDNLDLRGENIVYVGTRSSTPGEAPTQFYHGDPVAMEAEISARLLDEITGLTQITVKNKSRIMWGSTGSRAATLLAEWSDVTGNYRGHVVLPLPAPVPSGQDIRMTVRLDGHGEAPTGQLRLHVNQRDVGVFTGTGRSNVLCLPCSEAAFTRLATLGEAS
jgi:glycosyltransferase involved in cell wall biosynthesis/SAM-dependent methyltransferase